MLRATTLLLVATLAPAAAAGQVVLEPTKDNTLFQNVNGSLSNGAGDFFIAGRTGMLNNQRRKRGLVAFDVAGNVPAGATVTGVTLTLYMRMTNTGTQPVALHRVTQDWGEGSSVSFGGQGAASTAGDATWIHTFYSGSFWTSAGGDFLAGPSATLMVGGLGSYVWSSPQLTADVQGMLDNPANNFGWILIGNEAVGMTTKLFGSRESFVPGERPQLTIDFTVPGPVTYCTAGTSASGCQALLSATGSASATAATGFFLDAAGVEGAKDGLYFFGTNGPQANPWGNGSSYQCVIPPVKRAGLLSGTGTAGLCDGSFSQDLNALWCPGCPKPQSNPGAGALVQAQLWYRDPTNTSNQTTSLSDALEFTVGP